MRKVYRQGDVLVVEISEPISVEAKVIEKDTLTLALGEATGHSHQIMSEGAVMYAVGENLRLMKLKKPAKLVHQEHTAIELPAGNYQIIRQREYTPRRIVNVAD
jgi:hypothetical protein